MSLTTTYQWIPWCHLSLFLLYFTVNPRTACSGITHRTQIGTFLSVGLWEQLLDFESYDEVLIFLKWVFSIKYHVIWVRLVSKLCSDVKTKISLWFYTCFDTSSLFTFVLPVASPVLNTAPSLLSFTKLWQARKKLNQIDITEILIACSFSLSVAHYAPQNLALFFS